MRGRARSSLVGLTARRAPVTYRVETIKGVSYAIFTALPGAYQAQLRRGYHAAGHQRRDGHAAVEHGERDLDDQRSGHVAGRLRPLARVR